VVASLRRICARQQRTYGSQQAKQTKLHSYASINSATSATKIWRRLAPALGRCVEANLAVVPTPGNVRIDPQYVRVRHTAREDVAEVLFNLLFDINQPNRDFLAC
jgi:hypothetical protein